MSNHVTPVSTTLQWASHSRSKAWRFCLISPLASSLAWAPHLFSLSQWAAAIDAAPCSFLNRLLLLFPQPPLSGLCPGLSPSQKGLSWKTSYTLSPLPNLFFSLIPTIISNTLYKGKQKQIYCCIVTLFWVYKAMVIITTCMSFSIWTTVNLCLPTPVFTCSFVLPQGCLLCFNHCCTVNTFWINIHLKKKTRELFQKHKEKPPPLIYSTLSVNLLCIRYSLWLFEELQRWTKLTQEVYDSI